MAITAADVNKLRKTTGAGMMDCKKALTETSGDFEAAVDYLRKKGQKVSAKRSDREATEGVVISKTSEDDTKGVIISLNCETDFVARNEDFIQTANDIATIALDKMPDSLEELKSLQMNGNSRIEDVLNDQMAKIGERIDVNSYEKAEGKKVVAYNHIGNKIGVLVALTEGGTGADDAGRDIAMQIAAMNPVGVDRGDVDERTVQRELEIAREQIVAEGKPAELADKIAQGKLNKFYKENTLLNQDYVKDPSKTVKQRLQEVGPNVTVTGFKRVELG